MSQPKEPQEPQAANQQPVKYADFRTETTFPALSQLPVDFRFDVVFFKSINGSNYVPRKHWCFFAEITAIEILFRLTLIVRDKAGIPLPVAFHSQGRGEELPRELLREGYTVAIMYAKQHGFLDSTTGIRLEDSSLIKVRPL